MPLGAGLFLLRHLARGGGVVVIVAVFAAIALVRLWPQIRDWLERRRR